MEPREGVFDFSFFDRFLDLVEETEMKVIFCTPTATPPAWLTTKYPEVLNALKNGTLLRHGGRRHYNYNSPKYRELSARVVEEEAAHYAGRKCILGWQIDNELNCETDEFYSEADSVAFRVFLQEKYGTLEALNDAWGASFWNQTYTDWEEVFVPRPNVNASTNPHMLLDYSWFVSHSAISFAGMQEKILRKYLKEGDFVTTNGIFGNLDNHAMAEEVLDFWTYDSYPNFAYCLDTPQNKPGDLKDRKWSRNLSQVRSASPIFGIMEQQSGANGWHSRMEAPTPRPGQMTLWTLQSIAHGADFVSYFRWRTSCIGTEIYWHGILDYSGRENGRLRELRDIKEKVEALSPAAGAFYEAKVGILMDYANVFDARLDVWHGRVDKASLNAFFVALEKSHTPFDFVYLDHASEEKLSSYDLLIYPHATIMTEKGKDLLEGYVKQGGTLLLGCRAGYKDEHGRCVMDYLPGLLSSLSGTDIPEYSFIAPDEGEVLVDIGGKRIQASVFMDQCSALPGAEVVGSFVNGPYAGKGALISHPYGKGKTYYYGSAWNEDTASFFLEMLGAAGPYKEEVELPAEVELAVRRKGDQRYFFFLNYAKEEKTCLFKKEATSLYDGTKQKGEVILPPYGTMVVKM